MNTYAAELSDFAAVLDREKIPESSHYDYRKRVRFFLDFCQRYDHDTASAGSVPLFISELGQKGQADSP